MNPDPFRRTRQLVQSQAGAGVAIPSAVLASFLFVAQLLLLGLFLEVAINRDALRVSEDQVARIRAIAGEPNHIEGSEAIYRDRGLLPFVWRKADAWYGTPFVGLYRRLGVLQRDLSCLVTLVLVGLVIAAARSGFLYLQHRAAVGAALSATTVLRRSLHRQAFLVGTTNLGHPAGQAVDLFVSETQTVRAGLLAWYGSLLRESVKIALLLILAFAIHVWLTLAAVLLAGLGWFLFSQLGDRWHRAARAAGEQSAKGLALLVEGLKQMRLVRGYHMQEAEERRFEEHLEAYRENELRRLRDEKLLGPARTFFVSIAIALVLFLVGLIVLEGNGLGLPATFLLYATLLCAYWPLLEFSRAYALVSKARRAAADIFVYLHRSLQVPQAVGARFLDPLSRQLEFDRVSLGGANRTDLLDRVSFQVEAGTKLGILSLDPQGPRAIAYLLARLMDPHEGEIRIDGRVIANVTLESLRQQVALVMADELLFTGTVAENIGCGDPSYSLTRISEAAKLAHAHQFIQGLPQGYETVVGDHGLSLTLSQKFRLGLARAALRDPALLVIQEPSEPLDADTKALVDDTLDRLCPGRTVLFLPGRNSTLRRCDTVLVLHQGKVADLGEHRELIQTSDLYRHVQYVRFNEFRQADPVGS